MAQSRDRIIKWVDIVKAAAEQHKKRIKKLMSQHWRITAYFPVWSGTKLSVIREVREEEKKKKRTRKRETQQATQRGRPQMHLHE